MCFWTKKLKQELEPWTSCTQSGCVTTAPPSQLRASIIVKLFDCFDAMGQHVNKKKPHIFNKFIFL